MKEKILAWWFRGAMKGGIRTKLTAWAIGLKLRSYFSKEANKMGEKKWYQSKTILANILMGVAGVIGAFTTDGSLDPKTVAILTTVAGIVNIVLRMVTDTAIEK